MAVKPTAPSMRIGAVALYELTDDDVVRINSRRNALRSVLGARHASGKFAEVGQTVCVLITGLFDGGLVNGNAQIDGGDILDLSQIPASRFRVIS